ncbi:Ig-like domain-containing protein [Halarchaeum salinum]|uniref:Ig-like domain-containing protein n=1 Tax=Halarchaeum salinum TaxID=489912 RepID=A0AAV3S6U4_9EURY
MSDRRAVAGLVGAVLLFGILVISLSLYQAQVVPSENQRAEFEHNQQVQNQLGDVRNAILRTASSGNSQPTSVTLGTRYPSRTVAVNPPPATGQLATESAGNVTVSDVYVSSGPEGLQEYLASKNHTLTYPTSALVYTPDYNEYRNAPKTAYENTLLYNSFTSGSDDRYLPLTGQSIVSTSGERVSLVVLTGNYRESDVGSVTVDPESVSTPSGGVYVNGSLHVSVPTRYPVNGTGATWRGLLPNVTHAKNPSADLNLSPDRLNFSTQNGTRLRIGAVGIGSGGSNAHAAYITRESARALRVSSGETITLSAQVHDEYLNPYAGVTVNARADRGKIRDTSQTTDENGKVHFEYTAPETSGAYSVNVSFGSNGTDGPLAQWTNFSVTVPSGSGGGGTGSDGGSGDGATLAYNGDAEPYNGGSTIQFTMTASEAVTITKVNISLPSSNATRLQDQSGGQPEIYIGDGYYDANDDNTANSDITYYPLGESVKLTSDATIEADEDTVVRLQQFQNQSQEEVDVQNEPVEITFTFADGSTQPLSFTNGAY